ncbi:MAG: phage tail tape measure protein [Polyangiaceae bacterium]
MAGRFTIEATFKAIDQVSSTMKRISGGMSSFGRSVVPVLNRVNAVNDKVTGGFAKVGAVGVAAGAAIGAGLANVVNAGANFEHSIVSAAAKFDPTIRRGTARFKELADAAMAVGSATEFGATKAGNALEGLAGAGFLPEQAITLLPKTADFATVAGISDLGEAADAAGQALGSFNLRVDDAVQLGKNFSRITDGMARAADKTSASVAGLRETVSMGAPVATAAGMSPETFLALGGALANLNIQGSEAGTTIKDMVLHIAAATPEAARALAKLGIKTKDANGNMLDMLDVLDQIGAKTAKMGTATKSGVLEQIFGKIPLAGATGLINGGIDQVRTLRDQLLKAGGSTALMAEIKRSDMRGELDKLSSSIEAVGIAVGTIVNGPLEPMIASFSAWAVANRDVVATDVKKFMAEAIPWIKSFASGVGDGATALAGFGEKASFVLTPLRALFGGEAKDRIENARGLGRTIVEVTGAVFAFSAITKVAVGATYAFNFATKLAQGTLWLFETAVKATRGAVLLYELATKAGAGGALAMQFATHLSTIEMVAQRGAALLAAVGIQGIGAASLGASLGLSGMAAAAAGAVLPLALLYVAYRMLSDAVSELLTQTQGLQGLWEGMKSLFSEGSFFKGVDAYQNKLAKQASVAPVAAAAGGGDLGRLFDAQVNSLSLGNDQRPQQGAPDGNSAPNAPSLVATGSAQAAADQADIRELIKTLKENAKSGGEIRIRTDAGTEAEVTKPPKGIKLVPTGSF